MTKTLTEQWREGTLPKGLYYVEFYTEKTPRIEICGSQYLGYLAEFSGTDRAKVLAPVPSYDEYKQLVSKTEQLEKRLEIATKALKGVSLFANTGNGGEQAVKKVCDKALKEMEGVK